MTTTLTPSSQYIPLLDKQFLNFPTFASSLKVNKEHKGIKGEEDIDNMSKNHVEGNEPKAELLKRVMSSGSSTSKGSKTPTRPTDPLSPTSGGARTPRAVTAVLHDAEVKPETPTALASDMDGLQVKSPVAVNPTATPSSISTIADAPVAASHAKRHDSSSTESSESVNPPSIFGGSYGSEGFPLTTNIAEDGHEMSSDELQMSAQAAAAIAAADEAIKQLNGTSSVIQGPPGIPNVDSPYSLPRGYANFVKPQTRSEHRSPEFNVHRQSSTSSSMTEASTSSEESDLCVPGIEWVNVISPAPGSNFGSPFGPPGNGLRSVKSPGRMAPPTSARGAQSPRRQAGERPGLPGHVSSLPLGATAKSPSGLATGSALPTNLDPNAPSADDDDEQTVGNGRDRSSSSSSRSTGLDLLWAASQPVQNPETTAPNTDSPYDSPYDAKGKRKAGAEAVAQWRASGIPSGGEPVATLNAIDAAKNGTGLPKKRRRSEIQMEEIDPALRDEQSAYADEVALGMDLDKMSNAESDSGESLDSNEDPEYKGDTPTRGRASGVRSRTTGAGGKKGGKAGGKAAGGTSASNGLTSKAGGRKARKTDSPNRGGGGGGGGAGGSKKNGGPSNQVANVQCEYVNPLPPYNRCQDVFTRKYDLPRHMARHARREGELVFEGKLSEDKALLWKTIKDKPKVVCHVCGESFTRMDALKRHQTKQHHDS